MTSLTTLSGHTEQDCIHDEYIWGVAKDLFYLAVNSSWLCVEE